jgi:hypothetical protein
MSSPDPLTSKRSNAFAILHKRLVLCAIKNKERRSVCNRLTTFLSVLNDVVNIAEASIPRSFERKQ